MKTMLLFAAAMCAALLAPHVLAADQPGPGQTPQKFEKQIDVKLDYLLSLPTDYGKDADKKWPLIVFLHGSGESANVKNGDVNAVAAHGPPQLLAGKPDSEAKGIVAGKTYDAKGELVPDSTTTAGGSAADALKGFIVVSPQCPSNRAGWQVYMLNPFLDEIMAKYKVDVDHVYLTGLSMGGYGTWAWAIANSNRFAAIAPMSGGGDSNPRHVSRALKNVPIWNFHGEADPTVPISESEAMINAVEKAGNTDVHFTRYPGVGHNCWYLAYGDPQLYAWFLKHTRQPMPQGRGR